MPPIRPEALALFVCPVPDCRGRLEPGEDGLRCGGCGRTYRIEKDWPVLIPEEARPSTPGTE